MAAQDPDRTPAARPRVVVGVDGSDPSLAALDCAAREAEQRGADLNIISSCTYPVSMGYLSVPTEKVQDQANTIAVEATARAQSTAPGVAVRAEVTERSALLALVRASDGADLLVVGSRGRGAFAGTVLGSVSRYCAHHAHCPVLVVRPNVPAPPAPGEPEEPARVVVGVDGSESATAALDWAVAEAARSGSRLQVVCAWRNIGVFATAADLQRAAEETVEAAVARAAGAAPDIQVEGTAKEGFPALSLLEASVGASMLVVGSRGLGGVKGALLGSVSQSCLHHAPCPVAIVHPKVTVYAQGPGPLSLEEIDEDESFSLLATEDLGRLAVVRDGRPEIFPVNYALVGRTIAIRTGPGAKLDGASLAHVAFEVEHIDRHTRRGWVVEVRGFAEDVTDGIDAWSEEVREAPTRPVIAGEHTHVVAISHPLISGRRLVPSSPA
ncbi:MAG TPA: universal stress protein [Acidimicrobiales bacterium]|nr:universal stress protein [Acidimicrobiales bacterium]